MEKISILCTFNYPTMQWLLARIHELHPRKDGVVRSVTVKTGNRLLKRPVKKIRILPIGDENTEINVCWSFALSTEGGCTEWK